MNLENFVDNLVPDRIGIIMEFGNPRHIYQLLCRFLDINLDQAIKRYNIKIEREKRRIIIEGSEDKYLIELLNILYRKRVNMESVSFQGIIVDIEELLTKLI